MDTISLISGAIGGGVVGMIVMYIGLSTTNKSKQDSILKIAKEEGESIKKEKILQAKEKFLELKENHEKVINSRERKMQEKEITFKQKDKAINLKIEEYNRKDKQVKLLKENLENQLAIIENRWEAVHINDTH